MNKKLIKKLENIARADKDTSLDEVMETFKGAKAITLKEKPSMRHLPDKRINLRVYNFVKDYYSTDEYERQQYFFVPMGIAAGPNDLNEDLREEILEDWSNPEKRITMIENGKVMVMRVSDEDPEEDDVDFADVYKPVTKIEETATGDNDEVIVTRGEVWEPGDNKQPIPRDYRKKRVYGEGEDKQVFDNNQYSRPLTPNWRVKIFGIGYCPDNDTNNTLEKSVKYTCTWYGEEANPNDPQFIGKKGIFFNPIKFKGRLKENQSDLLHKTVTVASDFDMANKDINIETLVNTINKNVRKLILNKKNSKPKIFEKFKKHTEQFFIPIIDLDEIHKAHMKYAVIRDEDGEVIKNDGGWDVTDFNSFFLSFPTLKGHYSGKNGNKPKFIITDPSLEDENGDQENMFISYKKGLPTKIPNPSLVAISLKTSRGSQVWDPDTKTRYEDPENAKAFAKLCGIKSLMDFSKINFKDKLKGDI